MEEKRKTEIEGLFKVRSYLGCLGEGVKLPTRNFMPLLKFLYPSFIVCAIVAVGGMYLFGLMVESSFSAGMPELLIGTNLFILFLFIAVCLYWGQLAVIVSHYAYNGNLSHLNPFLYRKEIAGNFRRACVAMAFWCVFFMCICSISLFVWSGAVASVFKWLLPVIVLILGLLFYVPYTMTICDYLLAGHDDYSRSLSRIKDGYRNWGAFLVVLFCGSLMLFFILLIGGLPSFVLLLVRFQALLSEVMGDVTDLPSFFPVLTVTSGLVTSFIGCLGMCLLVFPLFFLYGSIETSKKEKEKYEEEERKFGSSS